MFKTSFSRHNKIWGELPPNAPSGDGPDYAHAIMALHKAKDIYKATFSFVPATVNRPWLIPLANFLPFDANLKISCPIVQGMELFCENVIFSNFLLFCESAETYPLRMTRLLCMMC